MKKLIAILLIISAIVLSVTSCDVLSELIGEQTFSIKGESTVNMIAGETLTLKLTIPDGVEGDIVWTSSHSCAKVNDGVVTAVYPGTAVIKVTCGEYVDRVTVLITAAPGSEQKPDKTPDDTTDVVPDDKPGDNQDDKPTDKPNPDTQYIVGDAGISNVPNPDDPITSDPYVNVDKDEFYANYTPAISYMDSYYRTKHNLMSGSIAEQDQAPTVSSVRPMQDRKYLRNSMYIFSEDGNTYFVVNAYGEIVNEIYKGGAYVTLEEVAAYVFAFGEPPANHSTSKKTSPSSSPWGIYLRVNHTKFSGSTTKYPYEPELPNISGCGGSLQYWEMDVGTTGTDCDPSYPVTDYNNGTKIERGAARIVYAHDDLDSDGVIELGETYLFYTYNHYNDFQEYLNYEGGWGEMFGNVTGGGTLSSKYDYNPTPYVEVIGAAFISAEHAPVVVVAVIIPKREDLVA